MDIDTRLAASFPRQPG